MTDTDLQRAMCNRATSAPARRLEAFLEIQNGPNPLTDSEIRALSRLRPEYAFVLAYIQGEQND